jgi:hypothetical protein
MLCRLVLTLALLLAASPVRSEVRFAIVDGRVDLVANQATIAEVLAAWERVGQTRIVNAERLGTEPLTLQLSGVLEGQALDIVLRSTGGYVATERKGPSLGLSRFEQILVLPAGRPPNAAAAAALPESRIPPVTYSPPPVTFSPPKDDDIADGRDGFPRPPRGAAPTFAPDPIGETLNADGRSSGLGDQAGGSPLLSPRGQPANGGRATASPGEPIGVPRPGMPTPAPMPPGPVPDSNGRF